MQKRNILNSPRLLELKKKRHRIVLNKILISILGFLLFFILLIYLSHLNSLNISEIEIVGNKVLDTEIIQKVAEQQIAGNYLWFFSKANIFIFPQNAIKNKLQYEFKRIKNITLAIKNNKVLEISLVEREAKYTWCGEKIELEEKCYFMDENGFIFDEAPYFSGEVYFKFYGLVQNFQKLILFKETIESIGLKPVALSLLDNGDAKIFLSGKTSFIRPEIIFKSNSDFQKVAENLETALTTEPLQSDFKNKYYSLLYIDLRFGNKVYSKFK